MNSKIKITGKAVFHNFEGGFWGIESDNGDKYTPINMPEQLKTDGARIVVMADLLQDAFTMTMWGEAIRITGFETLYT